MNTYVRYPCFFCGTEADPAHGGTMKRVLAWVRSNNSGIKGVENQHQYAHAVCVETAMMRSRNRQGDKGEMLF